MTDSCSPNLIIFREAFRKASSLSLRGLILLIKWQYKRGVSRFYTLEHEFLSTSRFDLIKGVFGQVRGIWGPEYLYWPCSLEVSIYTIMSADDIAI